MRDLASPDALLEMRSEQIRLHLRQFARESLEVRQIRLRLGNDANAEKCLGNSLLTRPAIQRVGLFIENYWQSPRIGSLEATAIAAPRHSPSLRH